MRREISADELSEWTITPGTSQERGLDQAINTIMNSAIGNIVIDIERLSLLNVDSSPKTSKQFKNEVLEILQNYQKRKHWA